MPLGPSPVPSQSLPLASCARLRPPPPRALGFASCLTVGASYSWLGSTLSQLLKAAVKSME